MSSHDTKKRMLSCLYSKYIWALRHSKRQCKIENVVIPSQLLFEKHRNAVGSADCLHSLTLTRAKWRNKRWCLYNFHRTITIICAPARLIYPIINVCTYQPLNWMTFGINKAKKLNNRSMNIAQSRLNLRAVTSTIIEQFSELDLPGAEGTSQKHYKAQTCLYRSSMTCARYPVNLNGSINPNYFSHVP